MGGTYEPPTRGREPSPFRAGRRSVGYDLKFKNAYKLDELESG